jgi:hypothetical protein
MDKHCLAPWTHTYISPQSERRLCCASREPSRTFKQYIDKNSVDPNISKEDALNLLKNRNQYNPVTLEEHWNSEHMKDVRKRMIAGELLPECEVCDKKLLNTNVYKDYFNSMFEHKREELLSATDPDGTHHGLPISFDYRISNICTFKCRMCGPMLSSAWEAEVRRFNPDIADHETWMQSDNRKAIRNFQQNTVVAELWRAIKEERIEEIYWVGGEPLDWPEHWEIMEYMVKHGISKNVYARYNSNLSTIFHSTNFDKTETRSVCLFDLLREFKDWQVCASLDGTGQVGEYIRTGLNFDVFAHNFSIGSKHVTHSRQLRLDLTLTLPGMMTLDRYVEFADQYNVDILTKVIFAFTPDIIMSPLSLPRPLLEDLVEYWIATLELKHKRHTSLIDTLENLLQRPTFQEQWPDEYFLGLWKGKARILELEQRRGDSYTMDDALSYMPKVKEWWDAI